MKYLILDNFNYHEAEKINHFPKEFHGGLKPGSTPKYAPQNYIIKEQVKNRI